MSRRQDMEIEAEKEIAARIICDAIAAGYSISVFNGGDDPEIARSRDPEAITKAMRASIDDALVFYNHKDRLGMVLLVYGNSGHDVISDYTDKPVIEALLKGANALADEWEKKIEEQVG